MGDNVFSLRLSELEREALDRLARINGLSRNQQIVNLIAHGYAAVDPCCVIVLDELESIVDDEYLFLHELWMLYCELQNKLDEGNDKDKDVEEVISIAKKIYRQAKYYIINCENDTDYEIRADNAQEYIDNVKDIII